MANGLYSPDHNQNSQDLKFKNNMSYINPTDKIDINTLLNNKGTNN